MTTTIKQKRSDNVKKDTNHASLNTINNICFTDREIDVIACLLGGRSYKKTASILSISPKTIEHHVRNIMSKIRCSSREGIIDFIEKSDKFSLVKSCYANIMLEMIFEQELRKLLPITEQNNISCLILHDESQITKTSFIYKLKQHLDVAGIKTFSKFWVKDKSKNILIKEIETKQINCIIYVLSSTFVEQLKELGYEIHTEAANLLSLVKERLFPVIFLLLDDKASLEVDKNQSNFSYISLSESKDYCFLFFELLKKILSSHNIEVNIIKFKRQYEVFKSNSTVQECVENSGLAIESDNANLKKKKNIFKWLILFLICLIGLSFAILKINKKENDFLINQFQNIGPKNNNNRKNIFSENQQKTIVFNLPPRNRKFVGREDSLAYIKGQLNEQNVGIITQAISGSGGIGKTQLATEFAYQALEKKDYKIILWVNVENFNTINYTYRELADILQVDIRGLKPSQIQILVHRKLVEICADSKVLFILDNVSDYDSIQSYIERLSKQFVINFPHILMTSRSQHWSESPLILDVFTLQEAKTFIKTHLPHEDDDSVIKLAKALHYFPLALNQAVAYIKEHTNITDYLKLYSNKKKEFLNKFPGNKNQYKESLWKTWNLSLDNLSDNAKKILFISSYLPPDNIPIAFFDNLTVEERGEAIKDLRNRSFMVLINNKSFKIHRLLQEVIRSTLANKNNRKDFYELTEALNLIKNKFNFSYTKYDNWNLCNQYLMHAQFLADQALSTENKNLCIAGIRLYAQIALYLTYVLEDYKNAKKVLEKILALMKQYYAKDKSVVLVLANINTHLGRIMRYIGDTDQAKELLRKALLTYDEHKELKVSTDMDKLLAYLRRDRDLSPYDGVKYDQSFTLYHLGLLKQDLADFNAAKDYYEKGLKMLDKSEVVYNKIVLLFTLSKLYRYSGNIDEAEDLLNTIQATLNKNKIFDHLIPVSYLYQYTGNLRYYMGLYDDAREDLENCLKNRLSMYSVDHLRIGCTKAILGLVLCANNRIREGVDNLKQAEKIYNKFLKEDHLRYIFLYIHLGYAYEIHKEYDNALQYFIKAQKIATKYWGEKSRIVLSHHLSPIEKFPALKTSEKNVNYYEKTLNIVKTLFGKDHIRTARYHYLLGQIFENIQNKIQAKRCYQRALDIANKQHFSNKILVAGHQKNIKIIQDRLKKLVNN